MRQILILSAFCYFNFAFSQPKIVEQYTEKWDLSETVWNPKYLEKLEYNSADLITFHQRTNWIVQAHEVFRYRDWFRTYNYDNFNNVTYTHDSTITLSFPVQDTLIYNTKIAEVWYFYDANQNLIYDSTSLDSVNPTITTHYSYNTDNELFYEKSYKHADGEKELVLEYFYEYDDNGCLLQEVSISYLLERTLKYEYEYYENCQIKEYTRDIDYESNPDNNVLDKWYYEYEENGLTEFEQYEKFNFEAEEWEISHTISFLYSETQKLLHSQYESISSSIKGTSFFEYDAHDNLILERYFLDLPNEPERLVERDSFIYDYDDGDFITKQEKINSKWTTSGLLNQTKEVFRYENFCDGLVKKESYDKLEHEILERTAYKYDQLTDCQENKEEEYLEVFPNPSTGIIQINSNILYSENNQIRIFSANGKFIKSYQNSFRTEEKLLDLSGLSNGLYFIEVENSSKRLMGKLIIAK